MHHDANIQHKPVIQGESGFAFENGVRVPIVEPPEPAEDSPQSAFEKGYAAGCEDTLRLFFTALFEGSSKPQDMGLKVHLLAYGAGLHPNLPKSQSDLASVLKVSEGTITNLKAKFSKSSNVFKENFKGTMKTLNHPPMVG